MSATMTMTKTQTIAQQRKIVMKPVVEQWLATEEEESRRVEELSQERKFLHRDNIVWINVVAFLLLHTFSAIGLYQAFFVAQWKTVAWAILLWIIGGLGITAGPHRLWAHRSYKARAPLRAILVAMNCVAFQNSVIEWVRDHMAHHKWSDTDADPHNIKRGFFFAHMGWLLSKKHPMVREMGKKLDTTELFADPILYFQYKFYLPLTLLACFLLPIVIPVYWWRESPWVAFCLPASFRYCFTLHATWFINSAAHTFGYRPYDITIAPTESMITTLTAFGEGGHNYHHTFPQDYRTSEMPHVFNLTKLFIDFFAKIGWAYDLRSIDRKSIERQMERQLDVLMRQQQKAQKEAAAGEPTIDTSRQCA